MKNARAENAKIMRTYELYLKEAEGKNEKTIERARSSIAEFEDSTGGKSFKAFHIDQAIKFKDHLKKRKSKRGKKTLSASTIDVTLRMVKGFFTWLAGQPGYKSRIGFSDAKYFSNNLRDARAAQTSGHRPVPSLEQIKHTLNGMPSDTSIQMRDRAILAFFALTGIRIQAAATLRMKHVILDQRRVFQDAREVETKNGKTIETTFFPVGDVFVDALSAYLTHAKNDLLFGPDDPLFPRQRRVRGPNGFTSDGLSREFYKKPNALNEVVKAAFEAAQFPAFTAHRFRHFLTSLGSERCKTPKELKAWSMNLGHEHVATTITSYLQITPNEQRDVMRKME